MFGVHLLDAAQQIFRRHIGQQQFDHRVDFRFVLAGDRPGVLVVDFDFGNRFGVVCLGDALDKFASGFAFLAHTLFGDAVFHVQRHALHLLLLVLNHLLQLHQLHLDGRWNVDLFVDLRQRVHGCQAVGDCVGAREIHVAEQQIARDLEDFVLRHQRHHRFDGFLALAVVAWAGVHHHVVQTNGDVVHHFAGGLQLVQRHHVGFAIHANDSQHAFGVVNLGDQVQDDFAGVLDRTRHVVVEVEVRHIHLLLLALQGFARHVADHLLGGVEDAQHGLQVLANFAGRFHDARGWWFRLQTLRRLRNHASFNVGLLVTQHRHRLDVGHRPFVFVAFVLAFGHQPFGLGRQRDGFGQAGAPKVEHSLRVFGVANQAVFFTLAFNGHLGAVARDDRDVFARPFLFFQDLHGGHLAPLDLFAIRRAAVNLDHASVGHHFFGRQFVGPFLCAVGQHHQVVFLAVNVEVFRDANVLFGHPFGAAVTSCAG